MCLDRSAGEALARIAGRLGSKWYAVYVETPQERPEVAEDDPTPDPWDVRMMALLAELSAA